MTTNPRAGYGSAAVHAVAGLSQRQVDYWARTGVVRPSVSPAVGSGNPRLYSHADIVLATVAKRLCDAGVSLARARSAVAYLDVVGAADRDVVIAFDGDSFAVAERPYDDVLRMVASGRAVFAIDVGAVADHVARALRPFTPALHGHEAAPDDRHDADVA